MGEHPSSVTQSYTHTMHFRQLAWLVALCTLMCAVSASSVKSELASEADVATTTNALADRRRSWRSRRRSPWTSKLSRKGTSFKLVYTKSGPYNIKLTYKQLGCKVEKCRMCRRKRSGRYTCLRKRFLVYVKSCYRRTWGWFRRYTRTSCRVTHYQVYRGYYH